MELDLIIKDLNEVKSNLLRNHINTEFYVFGSILNKEIISSDVDLLVIYQKKHDPVSIRSKLNEFCRKYPVDLTFMTVIEELEFNFVKRTKAINIGLDIGAYAAQ